MTTPTKPTDHQKPAAQREAEAGETLEVKYGDNVYVLPASPDDWPFVATRELEEEHFFKFIEAIFDSEQFATFLATKPTNAQAVELFNEYAAALGMPTQGE